MKRRIALLISIVLVTTVGYSQVCGSGVMTLNLYTKNGSIDKKAVYEIFPLSKELINKFKDTDNWNIGRIVTDFSEEEITLDKDLASHLDTLLVYSSISKSGTFISTLQFKTRELAYFPIIIKISVENKKVYILGNYFGGCDREASLIFNGHYFKLI